METDARCVKITLEQVADLPESTYTLADVFMDRETLFNHLNRQYCSKREMLSRIPLGVQPDALWQELLSSRRAKSTALPLYTPNGSPYWYVTTDRMIGASEKVVETLYTDGAEFDPFTEPPPVVTLEESPIIM